MRQALAEGGKPLHWVASSKRDFLGLAAPVKDDMGNALGIAQFGGTAPTAKPCWRSSNRTRETRIERSTRVRFEKAIYVLHAFQKKSPHGIRTAKRDVDLADERLKAAKKDYEEHYGKPKR